MVVATASPDGLPNARVVLLRGVDGDGFRFFTNFDSAKGRELAANARAACLFHWKALLRQVRARGRVERVPAADADAYWDARPRASRVSAWASAQSEPIGSRAELDAAGDAAARRFGDGDVPRPPFWGGYRVVIDELELWQHRDDRFHDRLRYVLEPDGWRRERLQP
jgi:pyridoxamine 5'-phosphate oxidase